MPEHEALVGILVIFGVQIPGAAQLRQHHPDILIRRLPLAAAEGEGGFPPLRAALHWSGGAKARHFEGFPVRKWVYPYYVSQGFFSRGVNARMPR